MPQETVEPAVAPVAPETTPVTPPSPSPTTKSWTDALDALPDVDDPEPPKPEAPKAEPKAEPDKVEPKPDAKPEAKKPVEGTPEKPTDDLPTFRTNQELRKWAKERHAAATAAEQKLTGMEAELTKLKSVVPKSQADSEALSQEIAKAKERITQQEQLIEMQAFEHSEKYQKEYVEPYYEAKTRAEKDMPQFSISEKTGEIDPTTEQPIIKKRPATAADFQKIYGAPNEQVREMARAMFGEDAAEVLAMRREVSKLAEKATAALNDRRQNYSKYRQEEQATQSQKQIAMQKLWQTANEQISKDPKRAEYWGEDKDDPEANKALAGGFKLADEFFSEKRDQMKPEERVEFDAFIRHTIAMGPRLAYTVKKLRAENTALKEEVGQLRGSAPGSPKPVSDEVAPAKPAGTLEAIDAM